MDPITASCHDDYKAYRHSGTRSDKDVRLIVLHSTEGGTALSNAKYFAESVAAGSAHLVVDDHECQRCLTNEQVPWAAPGANENGFHIEQAGFASWDTKQWHEHENMLHRGAYKAAYHCKVFNIPRVFVDAQGLKKGKAGITTHAEVSKAFPNAQGNHTDPGTGWPRDYFVSLVKKYYAELTL